MAENLGIAAPDFGRILKNDPRALHDGIRLLWLAANELENRRRRQRAVWQDIAYAAGNFGESAGTWTVASGDQSLFKYVFTGTLMLVSFVLVNTTTSGGMGTGLTISVPLSLSASAADFVGSLVVAGNITEAAVVKTQSGANASSLLLERLDGSSWPSSVTDDLDFQGFIALEIA